MRTSRKPTKNFPRFWENRSEPRSLPGIIAAMRVYQIFKHPEKGFQAVKRGFSWPGFFFTWIWALTRGLWLAGGLIFLSAFVLGIFIQAMGSKNWLFSFTLDILFQLLIGTKGNLWRGNALENLGYRLLGVINARGPQDALAKVAASGGVIPDEMKAGRRAPGFFQVPQGLQAMCAVISLTWKAAFRYKLFWVITTLLLCAVVGLPLLVKDDGTAQGFAQILLTYTLGSITALLGLCTLWLACGTLARDVEECQMQMVVVKPIARWQIWIGKWLGLVSLNAVLLAVAGASIYGLLEWRSKRLSPLELFKLQNEVLVARASVREGSLDKDIETETDRRFEERRKTGKLEGVDPRAVRQQLESQVKAELQVVAPGELHPWLIHLGVAGNRLKNKPLYLRVKFNPASADASETFLAEWQVGDPAKTTPWQSGVMSLSPDTYHEFPVGPNLFDEKGDLIILFRNPNKTALLFPLGEGMEVLYREGGFGFNFIRGLGVILCWMSLLAALGLAQASFLSFPTAAFASLTLLAMSFSTGTLSTVVEEGTIVGWDSEASKYGHSLLDYVVVPIFRVALTVINLAKHFSPIDSLSTGRSITWSELGLAVSQIVLLMGGILVVFGIFVFNRRELATAQGTH